MRQLIDADLVRPLVLAEPVHFEPGSTTLYSSEFDPAEHLDRVRDVLDDYGVTFRTLSYAGHSGAGCNSQNGMYEVLTRFDDLVGPFAPSMRLWGLMDICYSGAFTWQRPASALAGRGVVVANMFTTGGSVGNVNALEAGLLGGSAPALACDESLYGSSVRSASEPVQLSHAHRGRHQPLEQFLLLPPRDPPAGLRARSERHALPLMPCLRSAQAVWLPCVEQRARKDGARRGRRAAGGPG